jgi:hypothetical protein
MTFIYSETPDLATAPMEGEWFQPTATFIGYIESLD